MEEWLLYNTTNIALMENFTFVDTTKDNWKYGWGEPERFICNGSIAIYYLWKTIQILDYESFYKDENLVRHWKSILNEKRNN